MSTPSVAASYRGLFAQPLLRRLAVADVCARLPQGMVTVTLLLVAAQHASSRPRSRWTPPSSTWPTSPAR
jgi:hypothetical protein